MIRTAEYNLAKYLIKIINDVMPTTYMLNLTGSFVSDRQFNIFCVYAPTAANNHKAECCTFYDKLSSLVNDIPLRDHILICGDLNAPLTAYGCRVKMYVASRTANRLPYRLLYDLIYNITLLSNCCKRHHATKTKQVADLWRSEGEMHALRLDIQ